MLGTTLRAMPVSPGGGCDARGWGWAGPRWLYVALLLLCGAGTADAAGKSIFQLGTLIDHKPWTVMVMYFAVFLITIMLELTVHYVNHTVTSDSGHHIAHHVTQEVMILGGIAAVLVVFENLGGAALIDTALFHYVHFVVFVMAILFITMVSLLFAIVERSWLKWSRFENGLDNIEFDPSLDQETRCAFMDKYVNSYNAGAKMAAAIVFFKTNLPERLRGVPFARYMQKMQRKFMLEFLNLHVSSWALLGFLMFVAAVVTAITNEISQNTLVTIGLWVLIVGYGSLFVLVVVFFKIRREFSDFASEVQYRSTEGRGRVRRQSDHFWRNPHFMLKIMQTMLLYQMFFLATVITNFAYRLINDESTSGEGWLLVVVCVLPSLLVFLVMIPLILPPFTVLASMGEYLDHDVVITMMAKDKSSGRYRRHWQREHEMVAPPKYFIRKDGVLVQHPVPAPPPPADKREHQCGECQRNPAAVRCPTCGFLCADCDVDYHRLRMQASHHREPIGREAAPVAKKKKESAHTRLLARLEEMEKMDKRRQAAAGDAPAGSTAGGSVTGTPGPESFLVPSFSPGRRNTDATSSSFREDSADALERSTSDYQPLLPHNKRKR
eukprot:TRINITY_DN24766_c0_g1_i1.p1 TRINITY_DN24766_c0_g1~~TRINITY_DN24766_c0_g1_i1.p1  ORF type:complete len:609 (+),score=260.55 TRINITY_DN24766_c0_g1_i1:304-2130(+)